MNLSEIKSLSSFRSFQNLHRLLLDRQKDGEGIFNRYQLESGARIGLRCTFDLSKRFKYVKFEFYSANNNSNSYTINFPPDTSKWTKEAVEVANSKMFADTLEEEIRCLKICKQNLALLQKIIKRQHQGILTLKGITLRWEDVHFRILEDWCDGMKKKINLHCVIRYNLRGITEDDWNRKEVGGFLGDSWHRLLQSFSYSLEDIFGDPENLKRLQKYATKLAALPADPYMLLADIIQLKVQGSIKFPDAKGSVEWKPSALNHTGIKVSQYGKGRFDVIDEYELTDSRKTSSTAGYTYKAVKNNGVKTLVNKANVEFLQKYLQDLQLQSPAKQDQEQNHTSEQPNGSSEQIEQIVEANNEEESQSHDSISDFEIDTTAAGEDQQINHGGDDCCGDVENSPKASQGGNRNNENSPTQAGCGEDSDSSLPGNCVQYKAEESGQANSFNGSSEDSLNSQNGGLPRSAGQAKSSKIIDKKTAGSVGEDATDVNSDEAIDSDETSDSDKTINSEAIDINSTSSETHSKEAEDAEDSRSKKLSEESSACDGVEFSGSSEPKTRVNLAAKAASTSADDVDVDDVHYAFTKITKGGCSNANFYDRKKYKSDHKVRAKLIRLLNKLADVAATPTEESPRFNWKKFVVRLKTGRDPRHSLKEEVGIPIILILADTSGSCSAVCKDTMQILQDMVDSGSATRKIIGIQHANGDPLVLYRKGKSAEKLSDGHTDVEQRAEFYKKICRDNKIDLVVNLGDADAINELAYLNQFASLLWCDSFCCTQGDPELNSYENMRYRKTFPNLRLQKSVYVYRMNSLQDWIEAIDLAIKEMA